MVRSDILIHATLTSDLNSSLCLGKSPGVAMFSAFARYKREAYRGSVFAPRILAEHGLPVVMKSDSPAAIHSRYLLFEAQQAHYYGLPENIALSSVMSTPAEIMGMGHRVGYVKEGDLSLHDTFQGTLTPRVLCRVGCGHCDLG